MFSSQYHITFCFSGPGMSAAVKHLRETADEILTLEDYEVTVSGDFGYVSGWGQGELDTKYEHDEILHQLRAFDLKIEGHE